MAHNLNSYLKVSRFGHVLDAFEWFVFLQKKNLNSFHFVI